MKKQNSQEKKYPFQALITYITLNISYINDKKVRIGKIHKELETEELKKSKYKIDEDETYIYDNQIDLDMFRNLTTKFPFFNDSDLCPWGIDIYVGLKNPDEQLNDNLCEILHQLCKKYLKTSIMYTSRDTIICRIENCRYSDDILKKFLEDFVLKIEKTILREI